MEKPRKVWKSHHERNLCLKFYNFFWTVAQMAKADVNANLNILSNYDLLINAFDGQCTADIVMKRFIEIITNHDYKSVVGILGK